LYISDTLYIPGLAMLPGTVEPASIGKKLPPTTPTPPDGDTPPAEEISLPIDLKSDEAEAYVNDSPPVGNIVAAILPRLDD
jgi:hypothetical protein